MARDLNDALAALVRDALAAFELASSDDELNGVKAKYVGRSGEITLLLRQMKDLAADERPAFGKAVNDAKDAVEAALDDRRAALRRQARDADLARSPLDLTLPPRTQPRGSLHPLREIEAEMVAVFQDMGYAVAVGPEVEHDFHNFEALNFPHDHPARDMQDTFLLEDGRLLRTHTSPVQIRTMLANEPPIRICAPGAVYRCDALDMTHSPNFHQVEGLVVDRGVTMAHLKGTLRDFASRLFGRELNIRLRPSFFPFTEPSVEVDVECPFCTRGCRVCKDSRWIEILGAGMVDPNVFAAVGIDPDVYTGFAFGIGVERVAMLKFGIDDIRLFYENDVRFLAQFR
ncbi:MAG: phenylalanine--tRNA ligase subunit alpha [Myxococcales bacterium]|nr:phenylalanine--tRNA ligase subunit alpha [Myxococcales bacterium]MCB9520007.1 phenylalanine--tRNA ligase subunit alpha [Myxococcales bacterium]MCB9534366.1 phenylalanine--tRNA ligase subunit alpha [Myxococcales bacterium]